jgi:hypothetical protein
MRRRVTVTTETVRIIRIRTQEEWQSTTDLIRSEEAGGDVPEITESKSESKEENVNWKRIINLLTVLALAAIAFPAIPQGPPYATGFLAPMELAFTAGGGLIVAEAGNGPNSGRLSLVDRATGERRTLIDSLPSGIHDATNAPSGPAGVALQGNTVYLVIGNGDSVDAGPLPGTEIPNEHPSSPILSSVLEMKPSRPLDSMSGSFTLGPADHDALAAGDTVEMTNGKGEHLAIRLVVNFPDYTIEPRPDFADNVRLSNPFGIAVLGQTLFVVDASQNLLRRVDVRTGAYSTVTTFASQPNPVTGVGGPFLEAVPNAVRIRGNELLVTTLSGFPFPPGYASIRRVSMDGTVNEPLVGGLTSALDLVPLGSSPESSIALVEFSTNQLGGAPGRLSVVSPVADRVVLADGLVTPTGLAVDQTTGEIFVTLLGPGIIARINAAGSIPRAPAHAMIPAAGSADGAFGSRFTTGLQLANPHDYAIAGSLVFRPMGIAASEADPRVDYHLGPFESAWHENVATTFGASGIGAIDIVAPAGQVAAVSATIRSAGAGGAGAVDVPASSPSESLTAGGMGVIVAPPDAAARRLNLGVRTFDVPAVIEMRRHGAGGAANGSVLTSFPAGTFMQISASELFDGAMSGGEIVSFTVKEGTAFVYGAWTENAGGGISIRSATRVP